MRYPISVRQGDTFQLTVTWTDGEDPINLTGYTYQFAADGIGYTGAPNVVVAAPVTGSVALKLTAAQTAAIVSDTEYSFRVTAPDGTVTTLLHGSLLIDEP